MIFISIVSHHHFELIRSIGALEKFRDSEQLTIIVRDNIGEPGFEDWCGSLNFYYLRNQKSLGFGKNNNLNFAIAESIGMTGSDYFLALNPDVDCGEENIVKVRHRMSDNDVGLATLNLFLDDKFKEFDNCVREFPRMMDYVTSLLLGINKSVLDKNKLESTSYVDWVAGSFMMFTSDTYKGLNGFDEKYFMYCEDIDICWRYFKKYSSKVLFFKDIYGIHYARMQNRKIFSRHFFWHVRSIIRYLLKKKGLID
jgi:N-acetylglucosaminyl-diphospho-decaprenol L-rhamnosyltransferase